MSEALILLDEDDDEGPHPATANAVAHHIKEALSEIRHIVSTGDDGADEDLLAAEQALRRSLNKIT
jgi:hypothetical protein